MTMRETLWTSCVGVCLVCAQVLAAEPVSVETIKKKWQERQDKVKSAKVVWTEERTQTKGSLSNTQPQQQNNPIAAETNPPEDLTYTTPVEASFQGDGLRYGYTSRHWSPKLKAVKELPRLCVYDGRVSKDFHAAGGGLLASFPDGDIQKRPAHPDASNPQFRPLMMCYRAMHPKFRTYDIEQFTPTGSPTLVRGRRCVELQRRTQVHRGAFVIRCWVDVERDYLLVREMLVEDGKVAVQIDIDYGPHPVADWQPTSWTIVANYSGSNRLRESTRAKMVSCDINTPLDPREFDIVFPKGTYVVDFVKNEWYIVRPDGSKRIVQKGEKGKPYEELVGNLLDEPASPKPARISPLLAAGIAAAGITLTGFLAWFYRRRRRSVA